MCLTVQREATETTGAIPRESRPEASGASPPIKRSAMAGMFGEVFTTEERYKPTLQLVKEEEDCLSLDSDHLHGGGN